MRSVTTLPIRAPVALHFTVQTYHLVSRHCVLLHYGLGVPRTDSGKADGFYLLQIVQTVCGVQSASYLTGDGGKAAGT